MTKNKKKVPVFRLLYGEKYITAGEWRDRLKWTLERRRLAIANGLLKDVAFVLSSEIEQGNIRQKARSGAMALLAERIEGIQQFLDEQKKKR